MKSLVLVGALALTTFAGCVGVTVGRRQTPPEPIVVSAGPLSAADAATMAEIRAASQLAFDNQKLESLKRIAERRELPAVAQVQLVHSACCCLALDNHKVELLRTIIAHPGFTDATRHAIVPQLDKLSFDNHREEILRLINQRVSRS